MKPSRLRVSLTCWLEHVFHCFDFVWIWLETIFANNMACELNLGFLQIHHLTVQLKVDFSSSL